MEDGMKIIYDTKKQKELQQPDYVIDVIHNAPTGMVSGAQNLFDRTNLTAHQQTIYDHEGRVATEATYQALPGLQRHEFPRCDRDRAGRKEEYSIRLTMEKLVDQRA